MNADCRRCKLAAVCLVVGLKGAADVVLDVACATFGETASGDDTPKEFKGWFDKHAKKTGLGACPYFYGATVGWNDSSDPRFVVRLSLDPVGCGNVTRVY